MTDEEPRGRAYQDVFLLDSICVAYHHKSIHQKTSTRFVLGGCSIWRANPAPSVQAQNMVPHKIWCRTRYWAHLFTSSHMLIPISSDNLTV